MIADVPPPPEHLVRKIKMLKNQTQLNQKVPQTIFVPNHSPPVVSMVLHPPPPQMGILFLHFLPLWQLFCTFEKHFGFFHRL